MNHKLSIVFLSIFILFVSCEKEAAPTVEDNHNHSEQSSKEEQHADEEDEHTEETTIHLTAKQIETIGVEFGDFSELKINDFVSATGILDAPPSSLVSVTPKATGILSTDKNFIEGSWVKKGSLIGYIQNPEFITKQEEYLKNLAELAYSREEVKRQQQLVDANAGVEKQLQDIQATYRSQQIKSESLRKQLNYLGISTDQLQATTIVDRIPVYSPVSGYVSKPQIQNGMAVNSAVHLFDILQTQHLHLELNVFEKDIAKIENGQKITYNVPALGNQNFEGDVSLIGKEFNSETKTVRVHGHLHNPRPKYIKELFVNAKIWLTDVSVNALPNNAIVRDGESAFVYYSIPLKNSDEVEFEQLAVLPGATDGDYTAVELIDELPENAQIVTEGSYYIFAQSKAGTLSHEH